MVRIPSQKHIVSSCLWLVIFSKWRRGWRSPSDYHWRCWEEHIIMNRQEWVTQRRIGEEKEGDIIYIYNIAPPYLYILLGITLKHPNLIQKEVQNRDEIIAKQKHSNYRRNWLKVEEKKKQIVLSKGTLYLDDESRRRMWRKEAKRSWKKLKRQK